MGNAGTAIRLSMGLLAGQRFKSVLTGDASLRTRPMERVAKPLRLMGANIVTTDGKPPVTMRPAARLAGIDYALPVASAQVKSAILLAGLYAEGVTTVTEPAPTRDHTERMLRSFGVSGRDVAARACGWPVGRLCTARTSMCQGIFPPRRSSWWPVAWPQRTDLSSRTSASTPRARACWTYCS